LQSLAVEFMQFSVKTKHKVASNKEKETKYIEDRDNKIVKGQRQNTR